MKSNKHHKGLLQMKNVFDVSDFLVKDALFALIGWHLIEGGQEKVYNEISLFSCLKMTCKDNYIQAIKQIMFATS